MRVVIFNVKHFDGLFRRFFNRLFTCDLCVQCVEPFSVKLLYCCSLIRLAGLSGARELSNSNVFRHYDRTAYGRIAIADGEAIVAGAVVVKLEPLVTAIGESALTRADDVYVCAAPHVG